MNALKMVFIIVFFISAVGINVEAIEGKDAFLPCGTQPAPPNESIALVLWYKEGISTPFYR